MGVQVASALPKGPAGALAYRKDIDGLRGISILLVLAYHFNLSPITGGYIGVDVFFVISGYLITSLLSAGQNTTGVLAPLANFYNRRIKRLLPMFLVFATVTTIVATVLLLPEDYIRYLLSLRDALLFKSNILFDRETRDYFAPAARELPLLHTWTLSIEWQFYLLFPLCFLIAQTKLDRRALTTLLFLAALALAAYSVAVTSSATDRYFQLSARFFELLIGACATRIRTAKRSRATDGIVALCLAALFVLAALFSPATVFPGANALFVCMLAATLIIFGDGNAWLSSTWLSHTGKISYSAYLWHWPLIAFLTYLQIALTPALSLVLIAAVLLLAHFSQIYIEEPGRRMKLSLGRSLSLFFLLPVVSVLVAATWVRWNNGFPQRLGSEATYAYRNLLPYIDTHQPQCHDFKGGDLEQCAVGDLSANTSALMIGDSHARHYLRFVDVLAKQAHIKVYGLSGSECLMLPGAKGGRFSDSCAEETARYYRLIAQSHFRYVLIGEHWIGYDPIQLEHLDGAIEKILASGAIPVILKPVAEDGTDKKACFYRHIKLRKPSDTDCAIDRDNSYARGAKAQVSQVFARLRDKYPTLRFVDPLDVQCVGPRCLAVVDKTPIYDDTHHINTYGATLLGKWYLQRHGNPLRD